MNPHGITGDNRQKQNKGTTKAENFSTEAVHYVSKGFFVDNDKGVTHNH